MKKLLTLLFVPGFLFGQDTKENMRSIVDSYLLTRPTQINMNRNYQNELDEFHNYKNLPDKKLKKAIKKYANAVKKEDVLILYYVNDYE